MKKNKLALLAWLIAVVALIFIAAIFQIETGRNAVNADEAIIESNIKAVYSVGERFDFDGQCKIKAGENEFEGKGGTLVFPSGIAYKEGSYKLSETGKYVLSYTFERAQKKYVAEKSFLVLEGNYSVGMEASSLSYGKFKFGSMKGEKEGINVTLTEGDVFSYNLPIDLKSVNMQDIIKIYAENSHKKLAEVKDPVTGKTVKQDQNKAEYIIVRLTDCYDETNYVDMKINYMGQIGSVSGKDIGFTYYRAGSSGQKGAGLVFSDSQKVTSNSMREVYVDGNRAVAMYEQYGTWSGSSELGTAVSFRYDVDTKRVYYADEFNSVVKTHFVNDLDDDEIYADTKFAGFTTDEVYLSVRAEGVNATSVTFHIENLGGKSEEENLKYLQYTDGTAPFVKVDYNPTDNGGIYVAKGCALPLFNAKAYDVNLVGGVKCVVYYGTMDENPTIVNVKDNKFTAASVGTYTLLYYAYDSYGNMGTAEVKVRCYETEQGKNIDFRAGKLPELKSGVIAELPEYTVSGINGEVSVTVKVINKTSGEEIAIDKDGRFLPWGEGEYEISYECRDNVFVYTESYTVSCNKSDVTSFIDEFRLPRYFIKGATYSLDKLFAYEFSSSDPTKKEADYFVSLDGGEWMKADFDKFVANAERTISFKAERNGEVALSETLPVIDVNYNASKVFIDRYFQGNFSATINVSDVTYVADSESGDCKLKFINALSAKGFAFEFSVPKDCGNFKNLKIVITDYYNPENQAVILITNDGNKSYASINGSKPAELAKSIFDGNSKFYYENGKMRSNTGWIEEFDYGFVNDYCFVDLVLTDVQGKAGIAVRMVNNQVFQKSINNLPPQLYYMVSSGRRDINDTVTIHPAYSTDVLYPMVKTGVTVSVTAPDGAYASDINGVLLDGTTFASREYTVKLDQYGDYLINYYAKDAKNKMLVETYLIAVADKIAPTISFKDIKDGDVLLAKVGTIHKIRDYTCSDNLESKTELKTSVVVFGPNGDVQINKSEGQIELKEKGVYTVTIRCMDSYGNYTIATYYVKAE